MPTILQQVTVPVITNGECQKMFITAGHVKAIRDSFMCAGYQKGERDSCEVRPFTRYPGIAFQFGFKVQVYEKNGLFNILIDSLHLQESVVQKENFEKKNYTPKKLKKP